MTQPEQQSDQQPDQQPDLPEAPEPVATEPEPDPGGVDAIPTGDGVHSPDTGPVPIPRDPDRDKHPARSTVPETVDGAVKDGEDTATVATTSDDATAASDIEASS